MACRASGWVSVVIGALVACAALCPSSVRAGDSPEIPYHDLLTWVPALVQGRDALAEARSRLCPSVRAPDPAAFRDDTVLNVLSSLRLATKELAGDAAWFLYYRDEADRVGMTPEMLAAVPDARRLEPQLEGLDTSVKRARSAVKRVRIGDVGSALAACQALEALQIRLGAVEPGVFGRASDAEAPGSDPTR